MFMLILRHLAPLDSCPYMFNERLYACAKKVPITHVLTHYQLPLNAINLCFGLK